MKRGSFFSMLLVAGILMLACSGGSTSPILPDADNPGITPGSTAQVQQNSAKALWGVWGVTIDTATWEVEVAPLRGVNFTVDVVTFLQKPVGNPANLSISVTNVASWFDQGLISVDVGLRHPFPGLDQYTGFDVYGAFVAPGSIAGLYDSDVTYSNGDDESILLNPDGYTRWMNPVEFPNTGTILDFTPGALGTQDIGLFTSTINGYKYFADGLEKDQDVAEYFSDPSHTDARGIFRPGSFNQREYDLKFPLVGGGPKLTFQYAVIASWVEPDLTLSGSPNTLDVPGDWPLNANADEAVYVGITDNSMLYYVDDVGGGFISLNLEVFDWGCLEDGVSVPDQVSQIIVESASTGIPGGYVAFDQATLAASAMDGTTAISSVFTIDIQSCTPASASPLPVLISVENTMPDTFDTGTGTPNNDDHLAGYFRYDIPVGDVIPTKIFVLDPNGGETLWMAMGHEITWDPGPGVVANVIIEWSTDNFVSDIRTIVDTTENDGSYIWAPIPVEETTTAKVRVSDVLGTDSDESDNFFSIALPVWLDFEDPIIVDTGTVTWGWTDTYTHACNEISPAILQTILGVSYVGFYGVNYGPNSYDRMVRSTNGSSWYGSPSFWTTGGANYCRWDYNKVAPSHAGYGWMCTSLWFGSTQQAYGWYADIARGNGGPSYYTFDAPTFNKYAGKSPEVMTDAAGYIWFLGDNATPGIQYRKTLQPGLTSQGGAGQLGSTLTLVTDGLISQSRSWARQGSGIAMVFTTAAGKVMLAETTDGPTNDTWDVTEEIFNIGTTYTSVSDPALCADSSGRLFATWVTRSATGTWYILGSMREESGDPWSTPVVVTSGANEFKDVHISSSAQPLPSGTTEDVALVSWNVDGVVSVALSPLDLMAFLPLQEASDSAGTSQQSDSLCMSKAFGYLYDVLFAWSWSDGNWDIMLEHANFETP